MGKVTISIFLCLLLCVRTIFNFPTNNDKRAYLNSEDEEAAKSEVKDDQSEKELMSTTAPSTTLVSSIRSTKAKRKDDTKQPSSKRVPTATPAKPMEHASNSPTTLHIKSVAPIKSMNDNALWVDKGIDPDLVGGHSFDDPGCIDICHNTEIHPIPDPEVPNEEVRKVLPSLPDMIAPLKDKEPGSCCVWKCGKCNVTICKTSKPICPPVIETGPGCDEESYKCAGLAIETNNDRCAESEPQVNKEKCASAVCQGINDKCPNSVKSPYNIQIVQALEKCPSTCSAPALTPCNNNCPFTVACPPDEPSYFPPSITRCNNNYLGKNLDNGGVPRPDDADKNVDAHTVRQPTTHKVSTLSPLVGMKQFTANARADAGSYNPIQAMPTQPVLGPDDLIIHNIFVAEPYTTQNPSLDGNVG